MRYRQSGFNLMEIVIAMAILTILVAVGLPPISVWASGLRVELAAGEISGVLHLARIYSVRNNVKVAVKFRTAADGVVSHALFADGDGDGVRNADIQGGIDPEIRGARRLAHLGKRVRFGFPAGRAPTDPGNSRRRLDRLHDPIRFNQSDLAVFNPRGTATPGTIYLTDGKRNLAAVRVNNRSGKISILYYDSDIEVWR